jgi:hypothetical protein
MVVVATRPIAGSILTQPAGPWIRVRTDSLRVESLSLPDLPDQAVRWVGVGAVTQVGVCVQRGRQRK